MNAETNKIVMRRFLEFINTASESLAQELISPDAIFHIPGRPEPMHGPAGYLAIIGMMRGGFPDIQWTLEDMVAEGDKVAARFTMRGTHRSTFFGVPPTGKAIAVQAMNIYRLSGGGPTGSAMPLMWAHAEYVKLLRSTSEGKIFDLIPEVSKRYISDRSSFKHLEIWKPNRRARSAKKGSTLRVQLRKHSACIGPLTNGGR